MVVDFPSMSSVNFSFSQFFSMGRVPQIQGPHGQAGGPGPDSGTWDSYSKTWDSNGGSRSGVPTTWVEAPETERIVSMWPSGPGLVRSNDSAAKCALVFAENSLPRRTIIS
jgi:hypothetical protein